MIHWNNAMVNAPQLVNIDTQVYPYIRYNLPNMFPFAYNRRPMHSNSDPISKCVRIQKRTANIWQIERIFILSASKLIHVIASYLARDAATLMRFGHLMKPNCRSASIFASTAIVRTVDSKITLRSSPWNISTVPTFTTGYFSSIRPIRFTCSAYGVMTPMECSGKPFLMSDTTNRWI